MDSAEKRIEHSETSSLEQMFRDAEPKRVKLYCTNLARSEGFFRTLILGQLATSAELQDKISTEFIRTHRGHYQSYTPEPRIGRNDYLSFNIGLPQELYTDTKDFGGYGFLVPAEEVINNYNSKVSYGNLCLVQAIEVLKKRNKNFEDYKRFMHASISELRELDRCPDKTTITDLVQIARMAGTLDGDDQAEINIHPEGNSLPRIDISTTKILIPKQFMPFVEDRLSSEINAIFQFKDKIKQAFSINVEVLKASDVLSRLSNIHWYSEKNLTQAVMAFSLK